MKRFNLLLCFCLCLLQSKQLLADGPEPPVLDEMGPSVIRLPTLIDNEDIDFDLPEGFEVELLVDGLSSPRWILVLPNGNLLITQSRTESLPGMPKETVKLLSTMNIFGPSPNNLIHIDLQNKPPRSTVILEGLNQPFGMIYLNEELFIANTDSIVKYDFKNFLIRGSGKRILSLPSGPPNNHWTRNIILTEDENNILVAVGSGTNVNEEGTDDIWRAAIWEIGLNGENKRLFATGLRNPVGMAFEPSRKSLWATVNERDGLGETVPPDYLTEVIDGAFYGWPYTYFGNYPDPTQLTLNPEETKRALANSRVPDLQIDAHSVPLGLMFHSGNNMDKKYKNGAFVARRGGVSRSELTGYDLLFIPFENGYPTGEIESFMTGFIADQSKAEIYGRPVGLAEMNDGSILLSDDVAGKIWRIRRSD